MVFIFISQIRYKKIKLGFDMVLLSVTELICTLGIVVFLQRFSPFMVIDFSLLIGLIVLVLFTITKLLISTEENFKKSHLEIRYKYKKIIGLTNLLNICLVLVALSSFLFKYTGFGSVLLIGLLIELSLVKMIYKDLLKKSIG